MRDLDMLYWFREPWYISIIIARRGLIFIPLYITICYRAGFYQWTYHNGVLMFFAKVYINSLLMFVLVWEYRLIYFYTCRQPSICALNSIFINFDASSRMYKQFSFDRLSGTIKKSFWLMIMECTKTIYINWFLILP